MKNISQSCFFNKIFPCIIIASLNGKTISQPSLDYTNPLLNQCKFKSQLNYYASLYLNITIRVI